MATPVLPKTKQMNFRGLALDCAEVATDRVNLGTGAFTRTGRQIVVPIGANAKPGATAGWVSEGTTNLYNATLPASQTASTLVVPITGVEIGDTVTAVSLMGQVESAGNIATVALDVRKMTSAAADVTDASLGTDASGNITADAIISSANVAVTGLTEVLAEGEVLYALITATTAASTDVVLTGMLVTVTRS